MISCEHFDYIEIACMYNYPITLTLTSGDFIHGIALTTKVNNERQECIVVKDEVKERLVELNTVKRMEANIENPHFTYIDFTAQ